MEQTIHFKSGKNIDDGPSLHKDLKPTHNWVCAGLRDLIYKYWDLLNNL